MAKNRILLLSPQECSDISAIAEPLRSEIIRRLRLLRRFPNLGVPIVSDFAGLRAVTVGVFRISTGLLGEGSKWSMFDIASEDIQSLAMNSYLARGNSAGVA